MLTIANQTFSSRLFLGTGKFRNRQTMLQALEASASELVTLALRRVDLNRDEDDIYTPLKASQVNLLPNTSGARNAEEAVFAARLAREAMQTPWVKLEIHPDSRHLMPDPVETLKAAEMLVKEGFIVMPYVHADPVLCKRLEEAGCAVVMPLAAPIGSNLGLSARDFIQLIIDQSRIPVVVDAGIGKPSDAMLAMEMGADAVLVNTAIATAGDPVKMANAFRQSVIAGREAYEAGLPGKKYTPQAEASSPLTSFLDEPA
ncbi:thiazole synthase [Endozoicomonadaceae bacterium StTr2]